MGWTTPRTWVTDEQVTAAMLNEQLRDNLNAFGIWANYTPAWTGAGSNPTLGDGTLTGQYAHTGVKKVSFQIQLTFGSTSTPGSGAWGFSLPSTAYIARGQFPVLILDSGARWYVGTAYLVGTTVVNVIAESNAGAAVGAGVPMTWAVGDSLTISGTYEEL